LGLAAFTLACLPPVWLNERAMVLSAGVDISPENENQLLQRCCYRTVILGEAPHNALEMGIGSGGNDMGGNQRGRCGVGMPWIAWAERMGW
jgi:hypothetical protein